MFNINVYREISGNVEHTIRKRKKRHDLDPPFSVSKVLSSHPRENVVFWVQNKKSTLSLLFLFLGLFFSPQLILSI